MKTLLLVLTFIAATAQADLINRPAPQITKDSPEADRVEWTVKQLSNINTNAVKCLKQSMGADFALTFKNPLNVTADKVFKGLGADGCKAHMAFLAANQLISAADSLYVAPSEPCTVTCNQDGTATVACPQPSPSPNL